MSVDGQPGEAGAEQVGRGQWAVKCGGQGYGKGDLARRLLLCS